MSTFRGTFEEFTERCQEIYLKSEGIDGDLQLTYWGPRTNWRHDSGEKITKPRLFVEWSTGGVSGGSCWDNSNPQPYTNNDKPKELQILDAILENICPSISFLQYKNLVNSLIKYDSRTESEYYGNSTDYTSQMVVLRELYNYLKEHNFIEE